MQVADGEVWVELEEALFDQVVVAQIPEFIGDATDFVQVGDDQALGVERQEEVAEIFHFGRDGHIRTGFAEPEMGEDDIGRGKGRDVLGLVGAGVAGEEPGLGAALDVVAHGGDAAQDAVRGGVVVETVEGGDGEAVEVEGFTGAGDEDVAGVEVAIGDEGQEWGGDDPADGVFGQGADEGQVEVVGVLVGEEDEIQGLEVGGQVEGWGLVEAGVDGEGVDRPADVLGAEEVVGGVDEPALVEGAVGLPGGNKLLPEGWIGAYDLFFRRSDGFVTLIKRKHGCNGWR